MMKNKKIVAIISTVAILGAGATGVGYYMQYKNQDTLNENVKDKKLSQSKQDKIVADLSQMRKDGYRPTEIETELKAKIKQLDKKHATKAVCVLMNSISDTSNYFNAIFQDMENEILYSNYVDNVDNTMKNLNKMSNEFAKGYLKEAKRQHLYVIETNSYFFFEKNGEYIFDKYGDYVQGDYKEYLNLLAKQKRDPIFDYKKEMYNLDRIRDDLVAIDNARDRWEKGDFKAEFTEMEKTLYEALLSESHATFFDITVKNKGKDNEEDVYTLKKDILKKYKQIINENKDLTISKDVSNYLKVLKENDYKLNAKVNKYVEKFLEEKFPPIEEDEESTVDTSSNK